MSDFEVTLSFLKEKGFSTVETYNEKCSKCGLFCRIVHDDGTYICTRCFEGEHGSIHEHINEVRLKHRVDEVLDQCDQIILSNDLEIDFALWIKSQLQHE